jgi:predicted RNase H-like nuclease
MRLTALLGLDGGRNRWTGFKLLCDRRGRVLHQALRRTKRGRLDPQAVLEEFGEPEVLCVDAPLGGRGRATDYRPCDRGAREYLGAKRGSVFYVPSKRRFRAYKRKPNTSQADLNKLSDPGKKLSSQVWGVLRYTAAAEELRRELGGRRVIEGHPETAYQALNGDEPLRFKKNEDDGRLERIMLLPFELEELGPLDADALDAAVLAHVAWCAWRGRARVITNRRGPRKAGLGGKYPGIWLP